MPTRREALVMGGAALVLCPLVSCKGAGRLPAGALEVSLADLPEGRRVVAMRVDEPVELRRTGPEVRARSLFCPHFGCRLVWDEGHARYECPCHGGAFDADGRPVAGPPTEPMRELAVTIRGEWAIVMPRGAI